MSVASIRTPLRRRRAQNANPVDDRAGRLPVVTTRAGRSAAPPLELHRRPGLSDRSGKLGDRLQVVGMADVDKKTVGVVEVGGDSELVVARGRGRSRTTGSPGSALEAVERSGESFLLHFGRAVLEGEHHDVTEHRILLI